MASSLVSIKRRTKTVVTTQKITNAMKLVSISKLQRYRSLLNRFRRITEELESITHHAVVSDKEKLYLAFFPDMGLVSNFSRNLIRYLADLGKEAVFMFGTQGFEKLKATSNCNILNDKISGELLNVNELTDLCALYQRYYQIIPITAEISTDGTVVLQEMNTEVEIEPNFKLLLEPDKKTASSAFKEMYMKAQVIQAYYISKISEYNIRHLLMDQASDNAEKMLEQLSIQYNRVRQEKITAEITDLASAED